ncbi:acyltransferase family protein [Diplocloster agilis]|uniref:Acyltransferase family protein n=1 Tax=Diplocloster agilis TaxID=2850323 RepID=A0A949N9M8_9FIRM|nr:acyltransferase family protein [Diplocloster agilis]MBU9735542.1 acyltransferase family protein [Diplocloster agilis]
MVTGSRNKSIDFYKGMLMFGVIWGHTITALRAGMGESVWLLTFFRTYDMPFFMLLSGFFLARSMEKRKWTQEFIHKFRHLVIPVILWELLINIWGPLFDSVRNLFSLWFLWSAIGCSFIMIILCGIVKSKRWQIIISIFLIITFHMTDIIPFNMGYMFPFFVIGYYTKDLSRLIKGRTRSVLWIGAMVCFVILQCFWSGQFNVWNAGTSLFSGIDNIEFIILMRGLIGITGCITMKVVFDAGYLYLDTKSKALTEFWVKVGQNTMPLYILQSVIIENFLGKFVSLLCMNIGSNPLVVNIKLLGIFLAPCVALVAIVLELYIIALIRRIPRISEWLL